MIETFSLAEAAVALGKSLPNLRRWVGKLIPDPFLKETVRGNSVYARGELEIIAEILADHESEFAYFCAKHESVIAHINTAINNHRNIEYGRG